MTAEEQFQQTLDIFLPVTEDLESLKLNTAEILELFKAEIEKAEQKELVDQQQLEEEVLPVEEEVPPVEETESEEVEVLSLEEEPVDYMQLVYDELVISNQMATDNQVAIIGHLETMQEQGLKSNEIDGMAGLYMMYLIPLAVVISVGAKVLNPFLRG